MADLLWYERIRVLASVTVCGCVFRMVGGKGDYVWGNRSCGCVYRKQVES